jgi:phosphoenolpyruvate carboxykinase (GTP)
LWPGFGDNIRVLEWIFNRTESNTDNLAKETPIGFMPTEESLNLEGLNISKENLDELFNLDKDFWLKEASDIRAYLEKNVNESTPAEIFSELNNLEKRFKDSN